MAFWRRVEELRFAAMDLWRQGSMDGVSVGSVFDDRH